MPDKKPKVIHPARPRQRGGNVGKTKVPEHRAVAADPRRGGSETLQGKQLAPAAKPAKPAR